MVQRRRPVSWVYPAEVPDRSGVSTLLGAVRTHAASISFNDGARRAGRVNTPWRRSQTCNKKSRHAAMPNAPGHIKLSTLFHAVRIHATTYGDQGHRQHRLVPVHGDAAEVLRRHGQEGQALDGDVAHVPGDHRDQHGRDHGQPGEAKRDLPRALRADDGEVGEGRPQPGHAGAGPSQQGPLVRHVRRQAGEAVDAFGGCGHLRHRLGHEVGARLEGHRASGIRPRRLADHRHLESHGRGGRGGAGRRRHGPLRQPG
mmetsp:Transcript_106890/g.307409  ORF Transcript_106890/g.307409 Transcript_106890/m.307409 type:complete len:257 (+) Transcript_106890:88-858(+)